MTEIARMNSVLLKGKTGLRRIFNFVDIIIDDKKLEWGSLWCFDQGLYWKSSCVKGQELFISYTLIKSYPMEGWTYAGEKGVRFSVEGDIEYNSDLSTQLGKLSLTDSANTMAVAIPKKKIALHQIFLILSYFSNHIAEAIYVIFTKAVEWRRKKSAYKEVFMPGQFDDAPLPGVVVAPKTEQELKDDEEEMRKYKEYIEKNPRRARKLVFENDPLGGGYHWFPDWDRPTRGGFYDPLREDEPITGIEALSQGFDYFTANDTKYPLNVHQPRQIVDGQFDDCPPNAPKKKTKKRRPKLREFGVVTILPTNNTRLHSIF